MINLHPALGTARKSWLTLVLIVLSTVFLAGCGGFWDTATGGGLCQKRADYENALVREALGPTFSQAGLVASMQDMSDCDSSTYGSWVDVNLEKAEPKDAVAAFVKAGWSSRPASERSRDCPADRCEAYDLTKKFGQRVVAVSVEGRYSVTMFVASAADDCWDGKGYRCLDG
ncbi:hypothetical protein [Nonomuraea sp. NPDC048901]|uniref:hypothetical protein n=1 Tax=unclassified Nonomuraea TaxID=2593643 RepID=UPI0033D18030